LASADKTMPEEDFMALRQTLLTAAAGMSCPQVLALADLMHTMIRMRKPHRPLRNLDALFLGDEAASITAE
jgi:hypothetical protein